MEFARLNDGRTVRRLSETRRSMSVFDQIVRRCDGMLAPRVYECIYRTALRGGEMIEVGTALGAATVAMALGLRDSGLGGRIYSFDPMRGGPRRDIGTGLARADRIRRNLAMFGVEDRVELVPTALTESLGMLPAAPIAMLMIDADGRIDRDVRAVASMLEPDASIVIDDNRDLVRLIRSDGLDYRVDAKQRLTFHLIKWLQREAVLDVGETVNNTFFGSWTGNPGQVPSVVGALAAYQEIVFTRGRHSPMTGARYSLIRNLERISPSLLQRIRLAKRR